MKLNFLFKDVKEYNKYLLSILSIFIILLAGIISYNYTNSSYAKWSTKANSSNVLSVSIKNKTPALKFALSKVGTDGLETVTHTIDDTLQVTSDFVTEYRYRGGDSTVKNYVTFNNETWRIIGILPTEDIDGNVEYRFKLIRDTSIGDYYWDRDTEIAYNSSENDYTLLNSIEESNLSNLIEYGENDYNVTKTADSPGTLPACSSCNNNWARPSVLNTYLNNTYYNTLSTDAQSMIGTAKYYLGGYCSTNITSDVMWQYERKNSGSTYYYGTNPVVQSDESKKIALMYASDYGYAASTSCTATLSSYSGSTDCNTTGNWLNKSQEEWILPQYSDDSYSAFYVDSSGRVDYDASYVGDVQFATRPVLSLSSSVKITGGIGTSSNPYTLG